MLLPVLTVITAQYDNLSFAITQRRKVWHFQYNRTKEFAVVRTHFEYATSERLALAQWGWIGELLLYV
jgi:hypothetical protein